MDFIDERQVDLLTLEELIDNNLVTNNEAKILSECGSLFSQKTGYLPVNRGRSGATKIIVKPQGLFPLLAKIDKRSEIEKEEDGDNLLRFRLPPGNMPQMIYTKYIGDLGLILYRYITGGRTIDRVDRLDHFLYNCSEEKGARIIREVFDIVLKKIHWLDGDFQMLPVILPTLENYDTSFRKQYPDTVTIYEETKEWIKNTRAPHGIIHGDMHVKNILVSRNGEPVIIDFNRTQQNMCIFLDYATFENSMQFLLNTRMLHNFTINNLHLRVYGSETLILPRSMNGIARYVSEIRRLLWKACLSNTVGMSHKDIDNTYRACLIYRLCITILSDGNPATIKNIAYKELVSISQDIKNCT